MSAWIVDERCLARAGHTDSSNFNSLKRMAEYARQDRSYYDLPAVELYLANGVIRDLLRRSLTTIRRETDYKAALFYHLLENHRTVKPSVATATVRSRTTMVAEAGKAKSQIVLDLEKRGFYPGQLDDPADSRLIFANYPTHSKEQYELLVDALEVTGG